MKYNKAHLLLLLVLAVGAVLGTNNRPSRRPRSISMEEKPESFPFRPADIQPSSSEEDVSVQEFKDGSGSNGHGVLRQWWNWLWGDSSESHSSGSEPRRPPRRRRRGDNRHSEGLPPTVTVTVVRTVTVDVCGEMPLPTRSGDEQLRAQNARRQAAFNDWFDQGQVRRRVRDSNDEAEAITNN